MISDDRIVEQVRRIANERRIYAKRRADALAVAETPVFYRRSPMHADPPKSYGSPWMEPRRRP